MSIEIHPRYKLTQQASIDLMGAVITIIEKHKLTSIETIRMLLNEAQCWTTYALRDERHPESNGEKKADEA